MAGVDARWPELLDRFFVEDAVQLATVDAQLGLLPAAGESGGSNNDDGEGSDSSVTVAVR